MRWPSGKGAAPKPGDLSSVLRTHKWEERANAHKLSSELLLTCTVTQHGGPIGVAHTALFKFNSFVCFNKVLLCSSGCHQTHGNRLTSDSQVWGYKLVPPQPVCACLL